ncbi:hypothetical protein AABC73_01870 [Pseudomonas sp. G.S.17]|uniref:hypothetical protein n=1 Tax=Pseudomonas sp. G.S.17 TaxID=3137451 RepID=UPI00311C9615
MNLSNPLGSPLQDPMGLGSASNGSTSNIKSIQRGFINVYIGGASFTLPNPVDPDKSIVMFDQQGAEDPQNSGQNDRYGGFLWNIWDGKIANFAVSTNAVWSGSNGIVTVIEFDNVKKITKVVGTAQVGVTQVAVALGYTPEPSKTLVFSVLTSQDIPGFQYCRGLNFAQLSTNTATIKFGGGGSNANIAASALVQVVEFN